MDEQDEEDIKGNCSTCGSQKLFGGAVNNLSEMDVSFPSNIPHC